MSMQAQNLPRLIPVEEFFKNPEMQSFEISPSGKSLAFLKPYKKRMNIHITDDVHHLDKAERLTSVEDRDLGMYFFKTNHLLMFLKDNGGDENYHLYRVDVKTKKTTDLTPYDNVQVGIVDMLEDNDKELLIYMNKDNAQLFDVYRLNVYSGQLQLEVKNPGSVSNWVTDHNGCVRLGIQTDGVNFAMLYRKDAKSSFENILQTNFREKLEPFFFTFDNKYIYAASNLGRDKSAIVCFDPVKRKEIKMLFEHPDVDVASMSYSRKRKVLRSINYITDKYQYKHLDTYISGIYNKLHEKLGADLEIYITGYNKEETRFIVRTMSDVTLGSSYYYDAKKDHLVKLADRGPWLKKEELSPMQCIQFTSSDGLTIHGYLTLPLTQETKKLPVVILPHGGPWSRDVWGFNPEVQFLANRGYAVLQINFRGSTGYGRAFWEKSFKQWGGAMQQDITDGVQWLIQQGIADPKKVAIYGGSYGGYAALAGITLTPDLYACAVDYVGISNLFTFSKSIPPYWKPYLNMLYEMIGDPEKDTEMMKQVSPVFQADKIKAPLFIAQGAKDPRVNQDESEQMVKALKARHIDVEYMLKENEGHGFRNEENRFEFYKKMEVFLHKHLGGRLL